MGLCRACLGLGVLASSACQASGASLGLAPSLLPNVGLAGSVAAPVRAGSAWQLEARGTYQFLDDKAIADNGLPEAGAWTQLDLGLLHLAVPEQGSSAWSTRFGLVGFRARGEPNLVDEPGDYLGLYLGIGRFTALGHGFLFGPELTLLAASGEDPRVLVPQLTWGVRWSAGGQGSKRRASSGGTSGQAVSGRRKRRLRTAATRS